MPEALSRRREVWPKAERKLLDKATALYRSRQVKLHLMCGNPKCSEPKITLIRLPDGETSLQCGCTDRRFVDAF